MRRALRHSKVCNKKGGAREREGFGFKYHKVWASACLLPAQVWAPPLSHCPPRASKSGRLHLNLLFQITPLPWETNGDE